jgi:TolA-binding protein
MAAVDKLPALGRAVAEVGDAAVEARPRPPLERRLAAVQAEVERRGAAPREESLRRPVAIGLALGAAAAAVILWPRAAPLTFAVGDPMVAGEPAAWVEAPPAGAVPIRFSDGTRVRLQGGARVRVLDVGAHGARVAIERGTVRADVVPRPDNEWSVVGGPFEIHVTGTSFDAGWDPVGEVLRVSMHEGRVIVRAPCLPHERALVAGESASLSCTALVSHDGATGREPKPRAGGAGPDQALGALGTAPPDIRTGSPQATAGSVAEAPPSDSASAAQPPASWRDLSRRGDYKGAVAAAEAGDWGALCDGLSAADLLELGTTARLAGRRARAVEAYSAVRRRFGGSEAAANAAFHLGQLAFDGAQSYGEAHRWFSTYLGERPGGALAAEALGRSMEAEQRLGDLAAAREAARAYLARYPGGAHAELATSLLAP